MRNIYTLLLIFIVLMVSACSPEAKGTNKSENAETSEDQNNSQNESKEDRLTLENDGIDEEDYGEAMDQFAEDVPERVVTTSTALTEMLHELDIEPVGIPKSSNPIPEDFQSITEIGSPIEPNLELITDLTPDLILSSESLRSQLEESVDETDLETAYLPTDSFDDLKLSFKALGTYFDKTELMNEKMQSILDKENELEDLAAGKDLPSVLLLMGTSESFMVMSDKSYLGSLIERLGAENIATTTLEAKETYSPLNMEKVVAADPDMILVLTSENHGATEDMFEKTVEKDDVWENLSAYQNGNIHILDNDTFGVTSIKNVEEALTEISDYFLK